MTALSATFRLMLPLSVLHTENGCQSSVHYRSFGYYQSRFQVCVRHIVNMASRAAQRDLALP